MKEWVDKDYEGGRVTAITDEELEAVIEKVGGTMQIQLHSEE